MGRLSVLLATSFLTPHLVSAQAATPSGVVMSDITERPLAGAEVAIRSLKLNVRTDTGGRFRFVGIRRGTHEVEVRLIGFQNVKANVEFRDALVEADFILVPLGTLMSDFNVVAAANGNKSLFATRLADFEERRTSRTGKFLTADVFENEDRRSVSSILKSRVTGFKVTQGGSYNWVATLRQPSSRTTPGRSRGIPVPPGCYVQIVVNGRVEYNGQFGQELFDIDSINSLDIIGMEFYSSATAPMEFRSTGASQCGSIVIWTKGG